MNTAGWEPEDEPRLGRRGKRWFRLRLLDILDANLDRYVGSDPDHRQSVIDWYGERAMRYVVWVPSETYAGPGFAAGAWTVLNDPLFGDFEVAVYQSSLQRDIARFATLEAWLAADERGEVEAAAVKEPPARRLVDSQNLSLYLATRTRILKARPRTCRDCGAAFQAKSTSVTRCDRCCAARRATREEKASAPAASKRRRARGDR